MSPRRKVVPEGVPDADRPPTGRPVALVNTKADGVPRAGVTSVGLVPNTSAPLPVSPVTAVARLALDGVPKNVATPVPRPATPVEIGRPVALVRTPDAGVPKAGVIKTALVSVTTVPFVVAPVIPPKEPALLY